jgi:hypothetical protein
MEDEAEWKTGHVWSMTFMCSSAMLPYVSMQSLTMRPQLLITLEGFAASMRAGNPLPLMNLFNVSHHIVPSSKAMSAFVTCITLRKCIFNRKVSMGRGSDRHLVPTIHNAGVYSRWTTRGQILFRSIGIWNWIHDAVRKMVDGRCRL